jgi:hypothetical protein
MNKYWLINFIALIIGSVVNAQVNENKGLPTEQVNVVKDYEPTIINAERFFNDPVILDTTPAPPKLKYETITKQYPTTFNVEIIPHATIKGEPLLKIKNHYVVAGFGNYNTPLVEYIYSSGRAKKYNYAIHAKHFSSGGEIKNKLYPGISENFLGSSGKYLFNNHLLTGNINYKRDAVHYYGISDTLRADTIKLKSENYLQWFGNIEANATLKSIYKDSEKINYTIYSNYYTYFDNYSALETNIKLASDIGKYNQNEWYGGYASVDYFYNTNSLVSDANAYIINVSPRAEFNTQKIKGRVGIKTFVQSDTSKAIVNFLPDAEANLAIVERFIHLQAGVSGNVYRNTYKRITTENPFIVPTSKLLNTTEKLNLYGGIYGALGNRLNYFTLVSYKKINNILLYENFVANTLGNRFITTFDTGTVLNVTAELSYQLVEKFKLSGKAEYYDYKLKREIRPWQLPTLNLTLTGRYSLQDKIILTLDVFYIGARTAKTFIVNTETTPYLYSVKPINLKAITDLNLGAEYRYTKSLNAFLKLNNIAAMRYYRWNNYPTYRFNFLLGFTYSF